MLANNVDPDQMPHYVASDLGLHCLAMTFYRFPGKNGLSLSGFSYLYLIVSQILKCLNGSKSFNYSLPSSICLLYKIILMLTANLHIL